MKYGIYYAYWEKEWSADYIYYIKKISRLGFDILEIAAQHLLKFSPKELETIRSCAKDYGIILTAGIGPAPENNISSNDSNIRKNGIVFFKRLMDSLALLDIHTIGGALYSYWPVDYSKPVDKAGDRSRGIDSIRTLASYGIQYDITLCLEVLNRFESYILNTADEAISYVREIEQSNVKVMLDTFHMNIEENSIGDAIRRTGDLLGHVHIGECNRDLPGRGRMPWHEISKALKDIKYDRYLVMEPFIRSGGTVGKDIKIWRDMSCGADEAELDRLAVKSLQFSRNVLGQ